MQGGLILVGDEIVCPKADGRPVVIDLRQIAIMERRLDDVQAVTPQKAPELLATFNRAFLEVGKLAIGMRAELGSAERTARSIRSRVVLDEVANVLKQKGLGSAKDLRDAVLDGHVEYQDALERQHQIKCVVELLRDKQEAFKNAYSSVKKIMGEDAYNMSGRPNPNLSGDTGSVEVGRQNVQPETPPPSTGWGIPRY